MSATMVVLTGVVLAAGLVSLVVAAVPGAPRLDAALERMGSEPPQVSGGVDLGPVTSPSERIGAALYRLTPFPLSDQQRRALRLQDKSIAEFYADKAIMAIVGAVLPSLVGVSLGLITGQFSVIPLLVSALGIAAGFFVPDLLLRRSNERTRGGAIDALLVFIDLVTLERLSNASATQALHNAAELSDAPIFVQIRTALERARLEQQPPYAELRRLADQNRLPELADIADIMQLDETGAALSGTLRARVRELRDAHLTQQQIQASAAAEGMTLYMTLPAVIFGLVFLVAAMLTLFFG